MYPQHFVHGARALQYDFFGQLRPSRSFAVNYRLVRRSTDQAQTTTAFAWRRTQICRDLG